jgi:Fur family zinc uptake transcriptional regulator
MKATDKPTDPKVQGALEAAAALCRARGLQFTELRQRLLAALLSTPQPMGAYELMHHLEHTWGRALVPMTVYRALEFLLDLDLIARIESRNAYVPRLRRDHPHACVFFVCVECKTSIEVQDTLIESVLLRSASDMGFQVHHTTLELQGVCKPCQHSTPPEDAARSPAPRMHRDRVPSRRYRH